LKRRQDRAADFSEPDDVSNKAAIEAHDAFIERLEAIRDGAQGLTIEQKLACCFPIASAGLDQTAIFYANFMSHFHVSMGTRTRHPRFGANGGLNRAITPRRGAGAAICKSPENPRISISPSLRRARALSLGVVEVPSDKLWGAQTQRSLGMGDHIEVRVTGANERMPHMISKRCR
jgi:hypothetical protein